MVVRAYCYSRSTEPEADQGYAESKTFIKQGSKARRINKHSQTCGTRIVSQKRVVNNISLGTEGKGNLKSNSKTVLHKFSQLIWLTKYQLQNKGSNALIANKRE